MDKDGYPEEDELKRIREWPHEDMCGLMEFVRSIWWASDWGWKESHKLADPKKQIYRISTGGWSGNESIVAALQENTMFWILCWQESKRGGHYKFELPPNAPLSR